MKVQLGKHVSVFEKEVRKDNRKIKEKKILLTLLKKTDSDASAESTVSSSIQLGLTKLRLGKLRPVCDPAKPLRP